MHDAHVKPRPLGGRILTVPVAILTVLTRVGFYYVAKRYYLGIGAVANINPGYPWGIWVAFDVIVGPAIGCGGFAMALLAYVLNQGKYHPIMRPALLGGMFGYTLAGVADNLVGTYNDLAELMTLTAEGRVTLDTHIYPLDAFNDAMDDLEHGKLHGRGICVPGAST